MSQQDTSQYFDLIVEGIGYLDRVRLVRPEKGEPFWSCTVSALHGKAGNAGYTWFDCVVSGTRAKDIVRQLEPHVLREQKVLVGFRLADLRAEPFVFGRGERKGEAGVNLKARLLSIKFAKVDGVEVALPAERPSKPRQAVAA